MATKIAIVDVDGTLENTEPCISMASEKVLGRKMTRGEVKKLPLEQKGKVYDLAVTEFNEHAVPYTDIIERVRSLKGDGYAVIILTGRAAKVESKTINMLRRNSIEYDEVYHNPDNRVHDEQFKVDMLRKLVIGYDHIEIYEDKLDNIEYFRKQMDTSKFVFYLVKNGSMLRVGS